MSLDDFLKSYGINIADLQGQLLDEAFRVEATKAGVKSYFQKAEGDLKEGYIDTPYSTNVEAIRYYPDHDALYVQFNNRRGSGSRVYVYNELRTHGFDADGIFEELVTSPSPGHVVWERLRRSGAPYQRL